MWLQNAHDREDDRAEDEPDAHVQGSADLPARTSIILRVTKPLHRGTYQLLLTRNGRRLPRVIGRCLNAAAMVQRCP